MAGVVDMAKLMREEVLRMRAGDDDVGATAAGFSGVAGAACTLSALADTTPKAQTTVNDDCNMGSGVSVCKAGSAPAEEEVSFEFHPAKKTYGEVEAQWEVADAPACVSYVPCFLTPLQSEQLLQCVYHAQHDSKWVQLKGRRLQNWGGLPQATGGLSQPEDLPQWLSTLCDGLMTQGIFQLEHRPNHVLINEYAPGEGIMAHTDGPLYTPQVATISLGDPAYFDLTPRRGAAGPCSALTATPPCSDQAERGGDRQGGGCTLVLLQGSLVVFQEEAYTDWEHAVLGTDAVCISDTTANLPQLGREQQGSTLQRTGTRVSLTIRHVPCG